PTTKICSLRSERAQSRWSSSKHRLVTSLAQRICKHLHHTTVRYKRKGEFAEIIPEYRSLWYAKLVAIGNRFELRWIPTPVHELHSTPGGYIRGTLRRYFK